MNTVERLKKRIINNKNKSKGFLPEPVLSERSESNGVEMTTKANGNYNERFFVAFLHKFFLWATPTERIYSSFEN